MQHLSDTATFASVVNEYFGSDQEYAMFQWAMLLNPEAGAVVQATGGARKVRWFDVPRGVGTRGGLRVIYFYRHEDEALIFVAVYRKTEKRDLTPTDKRILREMSAELQSQFEAKRAKKERQR
jgi:hypothetical protein